MLLRLNFFFKHLKNFATSPECFIAVCKSCYVDTEVCYRITCKELYDFKLLML